MAEESEFFELSFDTLLCSSYHAQSFDDPAIDMPLPAQVDPRKLAHASTELSGDIPVGCLSRLASATVRINDSAKAIVAFQIDESGFTLIEGSVSVFAVAQCQRCLNDVDICIESEFTLKTASAEHELIWQDKSIDSLMIEKGILNLHQLLEDELILALPIVSYHKRGHCTNSLYELANDSYACVRRSPFDILKQLKS